MNIEKKKRKEKIKLLKILKKDLEKKLIPAMMQLSDESSEDQDKKEEEYAKVLQDINDVDGQITAIERNKNNSKHYEWKPFKALNRVKRRS